MKQITVRLKEGGDLRKEIERIVAENNVKAGVIAAAVGSLKNAKLRMPGATVENQVVREWEGSFEIVSMTGTLSVNGHHIHISISDKQGHVWGGHLKEGCTVKTTVELVILSFDDVEYKRQIDPETGFEELSTK